MSDKTINEQVKEFKGNLRDCISEGENLIVFIDENYKGVVAEELKQGIFWELYGLYSSFDRVKVQQLVDDAAVAIKHENVRDKSAVRHYKRHLKHLNRKLFLLDDDEKKIIISDFYIDWLLHALEHADMLKAEDRQISKENLKG